MAIGSERIFYAHESAWDVSLALGTRGNGLPVRKICRRRELYLRFDLGINEAFLLANSSWVEAIHNGHSGWLLLSFGCAHQYYGVTLKAGPSGLPHLVQLESVHRIEKKRSIEHILVQVELG